MQEMNNNEVTSLLVQRFFERKTRRSPLEKYSLYFLVCIFAYILLVFLDLLAAFRRSRALQLKANMSALIRLGWHDCTR